MSTPHYIEVVAEYPSHYLCRAYFIDFCGDEHSYLECINKYALVTGEIQFKRKEE